MGSASHLQIFSIHAQFLVKVIRNQLKSSMMFYSVYDNPVTLVTVGLTFIHQFSFVTSYSDFYRPCAREWKWEPVHCGPVARRVTKTAKVLSQSNDYQKLIELITFCEALNRLASVASICAHSHDESPRVFSYEWHPCSSLIGWAQPHIIEICRSFFFLFLCPCWKLCALRGRVPNTGPSKKIIYGWLSSWTVMTKRKWRGWEEGYGE